MPQRNLQNKEGCPYVVLCTGVAPVSLIVHCETLPEALKHWEKLELSVIKKGESPKRRAAKYMIKKWVGPNKLKLVMGHYEDRALFGYPDKIEEPL